jgi:hypothetical protein
MGSNPGYLLKYCLLYQNKCYALLVTSIINWFLIIDQVFFGSVQGGVSKVFMLYYKTFPRPVNNNFPEERVGQVDWLLT